MNKIYDKLLLAFAVLALLGGVGIYMMKSGDLPAEMPPIGQPQANPYQAIPVPMSESVTATWPEATETTQQDPLELYDVFTPPLIWKNPDGSFEFKPPYDKTIPVPPFGLYLAKMEREVYRIQLEGYIEDDLTDDKKSLLLLFDEEQEKQVRVRIGQVKSESEFKLLDFSIVRKEDAQGNKYKVVTATLLDQRDNQEVVLTHGERLYSDNITIILASDEDPSINVLVEKAPKSFETSLGKYELEQINVEASSVTVKKYAIEEFEPETKELFLRASNTITDIPETSESDADSSNSTSSQSLDFAF